MIFALEKNRAENFEAKTAAREGSWEDENCPWAVLSPLFWRTVLNKESNKMEERCCCLIKA